jgi:hypothetical protein
MGLDVLEFVLALEEAFQLAIPDADLEWLRTPRQVVDYVLGRLGEADERVCLEQRAFYRLRRAAMRVHQVPRAAVVPGARWSEILPDRQRRRSWRLLQQGAGISPWPRLTIWGNYPASIATVGAMARHLSVRAAAVLKGEGSWSRRDVDSTDPGAPRRSTAWKTSGAVGMPRTPSRSARERRFSTRRRTRSFSSMSARDSCSGGLGGASKNGSLTQEHHNSATPRSVPLCGPGIDHCKGRNPKGAPGSVVRAILPQGSHAHRERSERINERVGGWVSLLGDSLNWWGRLGRGIPRGETKPGEARQRPLPQRCRRVASGQSASCTRSLIMPGVLPQRDELEPGSRRGACRQ